MYDSYFPGLSLNGPRERERERDEGSRLCRVYTARVRPLPAPRFTPRGRICAALCTCTYSTDVARNLPCGHSTSGEGLLTRATTFFFSLLLFPTPTILSLWPRPVRRTKRGRWRDRARWLKGGRGEPPLLVDVHFSGTYRFFGGERNGTLFAVEFSSRRWGKWGTISILFFLFETGFLENFWINKLVTFVPSRIFNMKGDKNICDRNVKIFNTFVYVKMWG